MILAHVIPNIAAPPVRREDLYMALVAAEASVRQLRAVLGLAPLVVLTEDPEDRGEPVSRPRFRTPTPIMAAD